LIFILDGFFGWLLEAGNRMSLRVKLVLLLVTLMGASLVAQQVLSLAWQRSIDRQLNENARRILTHRAEYLSTTIDSVRQSLRLMAATGVAEKSSLEEIRAVLRVADQSDDRFEGFYYDALDGEVYPADGPTFSIADRPYFSVVRQGRENVGVPVISRATGTPVLVMNVPLHDRKGRFTGALGGTLRLNRLLEVAIHGATGPDAEMLIVDEGGNLVAGSIGEPVRPLTRPDATTAPVTAGLLHNQPDAAIMPMISNREIEIKGIKFYLFSTVMREYGWRFILVQPESALMEPLHAAMRLAWGMELGLFLLALAAIFAHDWMLFAPIKALIEAHTKVQQGDYTVRAAVGKKDEIGKLAESFNQMVASLEASMNRLQIMFEAFPHAVVLSRLSDGRLVDANPAFLAQIGKQRSEVIGKNARELEIGMDVEVLARHREELRLHGRLDGIVMPTWRSGGSSRQMWGSYSGRVLEIDGEAMVLSATTDITELKEMEVSLRASEAHAQLYRFMVDHAQDAIVMQREKLFTICNPAALEMFGCNRDEFIGHSPADFSPALQPDGSQSTPRAMAIMANTTAGVSQRFEWLHQKRDGTPFFAEVSLSSYLEEDKNLIIAIMRDITERKRAEAELQNLNATLEERVAGRTLELLQRNEELAQALEDLRRIQNELVRSEKMAALGALVAGVAHELNTPIGNAVTVSSTLLDEQRQFSKRVQAGVTRSALSEFLAMVNEAGQSLNRNLQRAVELVGSFKQLAVDQSSDQRRRFNLREVVEEVQLAMGPAIRKSGHTVRTEVAEGLVLDSYPGPLGQVLMNLLNNALIHAFAGKERGNVWIRAERAEEEAILITVTDDGCGMTAAIRERIFDPFFTTRLGQGGSGLGLHIVFNLVVSLLGGKVDVLSEPGAGSVFEVRIPRTAPTIRSSVGIESGR
jgi:PAS domain S-box-containing protein